MNGLKFTLLSFFLLFSMTAWSQEDVDEIPTTPDECYKYIEEIMLATKREECEEIMKEMKQNQKSGKWTPEIYAGLADLGNQMIQRKMKRYNFFRHVIDIMNTFSDDQGLAAQHFNDWIKISKKILTGQNTGKSLQFENYLKFSRSFWKTGNLYDISKGSHKWRSESRVFDMKYEEDILSITYNNTTLLCYNKSDSLTIKDAKGVFYPLEQKWKGVKGQVDWTSEGAKDAYALLKSYTIEMRRTSYAAQNATLFYNSVFKKPIEGILKDRAVRRNSTNLRYPYFESNSRNIQMDDIGDGVSYKGGFVMTGSSVQGYGDKKGLSTIYVTDKKGNTIIKAESGSFDILKGDKVVSQDAKVTLYINHDDGTIDSIYHPSINFLYSIVQRKLDLTRSESRISRVPFSNSLQEMDMKVTSISWMIDTDELVMGDNNQDMEMASENHFDQLLFEKYQNIISINPLIKFAVYSNKLKESQEIDGAVRPDTNPWDQKGPMTDAEFCEQQPDFCDEWGNRLFNDEEEEVIDTAFLILLGDWPPKDAAEEPEEDETANDFLDEFASTDPRIVSADELAALLDKRMEKITILTAKEVEKAAKNPAFKIIKRNQDYRDFVKGFPKVFKFGAIDVYDLMSVVPDPSFNLSNTLPLFLEMVKDGFIIYNKDKGTITLRDKLFHYVASVNTKKKDHDFDKIRIKSVPSRNNKKPANAVFDMKKGEIQTFGVQEFILSDSQQVIARPFNGEVRMLKGRNMDFNGVMSGGACNFTGTNFHFIYDIFHVEMDSINYLDLFIYKRARHGEEAGYLAGRPKAERAIEDLSEMPTKEKEPINSVIEGGSGLMLIDVPSNKSGRMKSDKIYPSFESTSKSRVYYNKRNRQGEGTYPRETFYYELERFMLDGMDQLRPEQLDFDGKLYAGDIFEPINERLTVMYHDLSLGFETQTRGNDPNPIYIREDEKGKGTFKGSVGISNEGLIGNGRLDYLGATVESEYIEFLPEQFRAEDVDSFNLAGSVRDGIEYPDVKGEQVQIDWAPYSDSMYIESAIVEGVPFQFFDSTDFNLEGSLTLTPDGLLGRGTFDWYGATLESNPGGDFKFGKQSISSPSSAVIIKSQGVQKFAFENENVDAIIDFEKQTGDFISQESDLATDLPYNSYQTSLDKFHWDMATDHIFMDAQEGKTGFFLATEQSQDSLVFLGEKADYDLNTGLLKIDGVEKIRVADAFIYPKDKHVEIEEASHMRTLEDSRIVADTLNQNHVIQRASINVLSRNEFKASGYLEFNVENKDQEIKFDNVTSAQESPGQFVTVGSGTVADTANFYLDKRTKFKGEVLLNSKSELLTFKGYAKISSSVIPTQEWFGIESKVNKKDVSIAYDNPKNPEGEFLYVGLYLNLDTMDLYPTILSPKQTPSDRSIFSARGVLKFDDEKNMYLFGDSTRVLGDGEVGKLFTVSEQNAKVTASGRFDFDKGFISDRTPNFLVDIVGDFTFFLNAKSDYLFETSANLDFYLPQTLRDIIVTDLQSNEELIDKLLYASIKNEKLHQHMKNYISDDKKFDKMWKKVKDDERLQLPNDFSHTFFFVNNKLLWSPKTQSFITKGRRMQLASIGGKHLGQVVKGHLEILNDPARGDALTFYIVSPNGDWYYFSYQNAFLKTVSSNPDYNNAISSLKSKDRRVKTENGNWFEIIIGSPGEYSSFKNKASAAHN